MAHALDADELTAHLCPIEAASFQATSCVMVGPDRPRAFAPACAVIAVAAACGGGSTPSVPPHTAILPPSASSPTPVAVLPPSLGSCQISLSSDLWNPDEPNGNRTPAYCACAPKLSGDLFPHPKSRMARWALDDGCTRHHGKNLLCSNPSPVNPVSAPAKACVDLEFIAGNPPKVINDPDKDGDAFLACVECPDDLPGLQPNIGRACTQDDYDLARRGTPAFNIRGDLVDLMEGMFTKAQGLLATKKPADTKAAHLEFLNIVRLFAASFGYCDAQPYGTSNGQSYPDHRIDLNKNLYWVDGATMGIAGQANLTVGLNAFIKGDKDPSFDLDGLGLELAHEMRHMGTKNFGGGDDTTFPTTSKVNGMGDPDLVNSRVANAEHMLNELEDYKVMFQHPWVKFMDPAGLARVHGSFRYGEDQERSCFAWQWMAKYGAAAGDTGYPPDKGNQRMIGPLSTIPGYTNDEKTCQGQPLTGQLVERCAVALWANGNAWMQANMLRSMVPQSFRDWNGTPHPSDAQPWNVLAHWAMVFPFRISPYCSKDAGGQVHVNNGG
ncbi:MAG TPA: hypothetical protein VGL81_15150 [Polyangiaceae bacterium]|jgi:hypothetical protein